MSRLSIVVPVYFNEPNLPETVPALLALQEKLGDMELELVFVDDGSRDRSFVILKELQKAHPSRIKVVKLTRNFGSMAALMAGLANATGDCVGAIAADLQDPPELFIEMVDYWKKGTKSIFAVRARREESWTQKALASAFYWLMRRFAIPDYPKGGFDFFIADRQVIAQLLTIREKNTNLMSLVYWLGFPSVLIPYTRRERTKGRSRWTLSKKIKLWIDSFVAFSYVPIRLLSLVGVSLSLLAAAYLWVVVFAYFANKIPVSGWASLAILMTFTSGLQMLMLGILGEYLWRNLDESRRRPSYVVESIHGS
ncbi:MAG TPA: glycosyltransferase family 2 protein [Lacunisphaera sp.]|jgi:dolichol-phosphate mannosyltransferase